MAREFLTIVTASVACWVGAAGALYGASNINDWLLVGVGLIILLLGIGALQGGDRGPES